MASGLDAITTDEPIYRVARGPDPWLWPDWSFVLPDGTFGNRWDDPLGIYRVLYASSQRLGAFMEKLQVHRGDPLIAREEIIENHDDGGTDTLRPGYLRADWIENHLMIGEARTAGTFADAGTVRSLAYLREHFLGMARSLGLEELDGAAIRVKAPRELTQAISRHIFVLAEDGTRIFSGVQYASTLGDELENWAVFEPADDPTAVPIWNERRFSVELDDPDLQTALGVLGIELV